MDMEQAAEALTPTTLSKAVGISVPHASQILSRIKTPSRGLAIRIWRATGIKVAPIDNATDDEIEVLARFES